TEYPRVLKFYCALLSEHMEYEILDWRRNRAKANARYQKLRQVALAPAPLPMDTVGKLIIKRLGWRCTDVDDLFNGADETFDRAFHRLCEEIYEGADLNPIEREWARWRVANPLAKNKNFDLNRRPD